MSVREAIVLAGGLGTRLRDTVPDLPKPLAPVANRPFLAWVLDALARHGIARAVLATGYRAGQIEAAVGHAWSGMAVHHSVEGEPLGTGGALQQAARRLRGEGPVLVVNGDTWLDVDPARLEAALHRNADIAMALALVEDTARYGRVHLDADGRVIGFSEKGVPGPGRINAGVYLMTRAALAALPKRAHSFETEILAPAAMAGRVVGMDETRGFIDIGVPEDYARAQDVFAAMST